MKRGSSLKARVFARVQLPDANGCMKCTLASNGRGYGQLRVGGRRGRNVYVHRLMYELLVEPIPEGQVIDHVCRNTWCVAPSHLEAVTQSENVKRGDLPGIVRAQKAAVTHCPRNHPYAGDNLAVYKGARHCLTCRRDYSRRYREEKRAGKTV